MWEHGHSMAEIDAMGLGDVGDVVAYWAGRRKAKEQAAKYDRNKERPVARRPRRRSRR